MKRNYVFRFREVAFDTDEGQGEDEELNQLLSSRFECTSYQVRATSSEEAFNEMVLRMTEDTGFKILHVEYDVTMT